MILIWLLGIALAFVAGFALARGGICAVAAVRQVVEAGRWGLFLSFFECAAWALLGLILASKLGLMAIDAWPAQISLIAATLGGALFGIGALVNGACALGSAGRLAAGEISFLAFIPGFIVGRGLAHRVGAAVGMPAQTSGLVDEALLAVLGTALAVFAAWRVSTAWRHAPNFTDAHAQLAKPTWPPALAMAIIAFANVGLLLIAQSWPYTALLTDLALGRSADVIERTAYAAALFAGAAAGAASAGRFKLRAAGPRELGARFIGGALMGAGAALIPGGNDSLLLVGLPLLQPSAFAAYAAMIGVIALGFLARGWRAG
jgi:toxin CptA